MKREREIVKQFLLTLVWILLILFVFSSCSKQEEKKNYKIGILIGVPSFKPLADSFIQTMTELGYSEGENISYDIKESGIDFDAYRKILDQFVMDKVDMIFTFPTEPAIEAKEAVSGTDIPVIFAFAALDGLNLVDSISKPGHNMTGVRYPNINIGVRRYEIMTELVPNVKTIIAPYQKDYPTVPVQIDAIKGFADTKKIQIIPMPVSTKEEIKAKLEREIENLDPASSVILFPAEPFSLNPVNFGAAAEIAYKYKIPIGGVANTYKDYASIFGVTASVPQAGKLAAPLADKVLKGMNAGSIPVITSELIIEIHTQAAEDLGVEIPKSLMLQATKVMH